MTVEYDGTDFAGFQLQRGNARTVQGTLEKAITRMSKQFSRVQGAGRTDAGVHATGQVVHFESDWTIPASRLAFALNGELPPDLKVKAAEEAPDGFHARFSATARTYRYVVLNREMPSALLGRFAYFVRDTLDMEAMREGAAFLLGTHDFAAFGMPNVPGQSTERLITRLDVRPWKQCVLVTVTGNAFLRQMVRGLVGTLVTVGKKKIAPDDVRAIRDSCNRANCPLIAPARGLTLVHVDYRGTRIGPKLKNNERQNHENVFGQTG